MAEGWTIVLHVNLNANERFLKSIENIHHGVSNQTPWLLAQVYNTPLNTQNAKNAAFNGRSFAASNQYIGFNRYSMCGILT